MTKISSAHSFSLFLYRTQCLLLICLKKKKPCSQIPSIFLKILTSMVEQHKSESSCLQSDHSHVSHAPKYKLYIYAQRKLEVLFT